MSQSFAPQLASCFTCKTKRDKSDNDNDTLHKQLQAATLVQLTIVCTQCLCEIREVRFCVLFCLSMGDLTEDRYEALLAENRRLRETIEERDSEQRRLIQELSSKLEEQTATGPRIGSRQRKRKISVSKQCRVSIISF